VFKDAFYSGIQGLQGFETNQSLQLRSCQLLNVKVANPPKKEGKQDRSGEIVISFAFVHVAERTEAPSQDFCAEGPCPVRSLLSCCPRRGKN
jgi:hypothetical protein